MRSWGSHSLLATTLLVCASAAHAQYSTPPVGLPSSSKLAKDAEGRDSWTYVQPGAVFTSYRSVIIEPTAVYNGPESDFGDIAIDERARFAEILTDALREEIAKSFPASNPAGSGTMRVRVTLLGVRKTVGGVATATRVTPLGFASSALKSALGKRGTLTGSVLYAVEAYDGARGDLMLAAVRRRAPDPLDIPATFSTTDTVKAVARDFAKSARERLESLTQYNGR